MKTNINNVTLRLSGFERVSAGALARDYMVVETSRDGLVSRVIRRDGPEGLARKCERRARLAMSASAKTGPRANTQSSELLDRLTRGIAQLKRLADQAKTALVRDAERRRADHSAFMDNARRSRNG